MFYFVDVLALPEEDSLLLFLSESEEEDVGLDNGITPKEEIQSNPRTPERIAPASSSSLFPSIQLCFQFLKVLKINLRLLFRS